MARGRILEEENPDRNKGRTFGNRYDTVEIKHYKAAPVRPRKGDRGYTREQKELLKRILPDIRKYVETPWKENEQNLKRKLESERIRNEDLKREIEYWMAWATDSNYYRC